MDNVNRWRRQDLGLPPVSEDRLAKLTEELRVPGATVTLVDMSGPGPGRGRRPPARAASAPLSYTTPPGWKDTGPRAGFVRIAASFRVSKGDKSAEVTVVPLAGRAGSLLDNVNRWRKQIGLDELSEGQFKKEKVRAVEVGGSSGSYVDLTGPAGAKRQRMLAVMVPRGKATWFFKMLGPAEVVGAERSAFETFLKSVKFTGAADE